MLKLARVLVLALLLAPGVALADDTHSLIVYTVFFDARSSTLGADDLKVLETIASLLRKDDSYEMRIVAFTDPVDEDADDEALARARARAVRDYLVSKGADKDRIDTEAEGDEDSFGRDDSATDRGLRRRAEILVEQEDRPKRAIDADWKEDTGTALQTTVFFEFDKADVKPEFTGVLKRLGEMLAGNPAYHVRVFGHTDGIGSAEYNLALGKRRSEAVIAELKKAGLPDAQLESASLGQKETIGTQTMAATTTRALSRSVEISIVKPESEGPDARDKPADKKKLP